MPRPFHPPWFDHPNNMWWNAEVTKLLIMQSFSASCHFAPLRSKYSPQASSICVLPLVWDQVSHPKKNDT
jgi:hypothetical protein